MVLDNFIYKNLVAEFLIRSGVVLGSQKWSETRVSSSGGGGYVPEGGGYVSAPTVSSTVTNYHEFWIVLPDGQQIPYKLVNADIPLLEGQQVTLLSVNRQNRPDVWHILLINHQARTTSYINRGTDFLEHFIVYKRPFRERVFRFFYWVFAVVNLYLASCFFMSIQYEISSDAISPVVATNHDFVLRTAVCVLLPLIIFIACVTALIVTHNRERYRKTRRQEFVSLFDAHVEKLLKKIEVEEVP